MWTTESLWFEIAIVSIIYALGNILMGHFEERTAKIRRVAKYLLTLLLICAISVFFGRTVSMLLLAGFIIPVAYVHAYYLPKKKGINGWTGEPKSKYYEFRKWNKDIFSERTIKNRQRILNPCAIKPVCILHFVFLFQSLVERPTLHPIALNLKRYTI